VLLISSNVAHAQPIATTPSGNAATPDRVAGFVEEASRRFAIPSSWICALMQAESGGDVGALSALGAMGLMQIMPQTWAELRLRYGLGTDPYDVHDNITAGAAYLKDVVDVNAGSSPSRPSSGASDAGVQDRPERASG
jgi:soluble lytic murein transglycosylase-like protein